MTNIRTYKGVLKLDEARCHGVLIWHYKEGQLSPELKKLLLSISNIFWRTMHIIILTMECYHQFLTYLKQYICEIKICCKSYSQLHLRFHNAHNVTIVNVFHNLSYWYHMMFKDSWESFCIVDLVEKAFALWTPSCPETNWNEIFTKKTDDWCDARILDILECF